MSALPFMPLYAGEYLGDTQHLSTEQHGAYLLLLMTMWRSGGSLPSDASKLARIVRLTTARWQKISAEVLAFFDAADGQITQKRLAIEIEKASEKHQRRVNAGSRGGTAKALKYKEAASSNATAMLCHSSQSQSEKKETQAEACVERVSAPKPKPKSSRSRIPDGWRPGDIDRQFARDKGLSDEQIAEEAAKLVDWALNAPPDKALKSDWSAAWRNWIRNVVERYGRGPPGALHPLTIDARTGDVIHDRQPSSQNRTYPGGGSAGSGTHDRMRSALAVAFDEGGERRSPQSDDTWGNGSFYGRAGRV